MSMTKKDLKMKILEKAQHQDFLLKQYLASGHKMPTTRRDFMRAGLISMSAYMAAPTLAQLIAQSAHAAEAPICAASAGGAGMPAFIHIQLNGGAALFANAIPHGDNGVPLPNYSKLGIGSAPGVEHLFSTQAPFWVQADPANPASELVRGIFKNIPVTGTNADIYNKTAFVAMSAESVDDRNDNPQDITGMLQTAGLTGSLLPYLLTGSGIANNYVGAIIPSANLLKVAGASSLEGSLGLKGSLGTTNLTLAKQRALVKAIEDLNKKQVEALASSTDAGKVAFRNLVNCASAKNTDVVAGDSVVDIYSASYPFAGVNTIWAKNYANEVATGFSAADLNITVERTGQAVATCLRGMSGATLLNFGAYDYHLGVSRAFANARDKFAGDMIGRILLTAKAMNKPVFLYVSTDGSLSNADTTSASINWSGDNPKRSMAFIFAYNPAGAPNTQGFSMSGYADAAYQLNHFSDDHVVANKNPLASLDAQDLAASAVFLNYLNFAGKPDLINDVKLAAVKKRLTDALPVGGKTVQDYFTRIKAG